MNEADLQLAEDDARVVEALRFAGLRVNSIDDLVNTGRAYPEAISTLVSLLRQVRHPRIKEGIARALAVKEAGDFTPDLINEFKRLTPKTPQEESVKWALGNEISVTATDVHVLDVIALMSDFSHGLARYMLPTALARARSKRETAIDALLHALDDDALACKASETLAKLRVTAAVGPIRRLLAHANVDIRKAASKALEKLAK